jgi:hypothetical protein
VGDELELEMVVLGKPVLEEAPVEAVPMEELRVEAVPVEALPVDALPAEDTLLEVPEELTLEVLAVLVPEGERVLDEVEVELWVSDPGPEHGGGGTGDGQAVIVVLTTNVSTLNEQLARWSQPRRSTSALAAMPEARAETARRV